MSDSVAAEPDIHLAAHMFEALRERTADGLGITRDSYGPGEQAAHELLAEQGATLGLEVATDFVGNTYITLPGRQRAASMILIGSHLDSVRQGGNFDGAAGVVAGLSVLSGLRDAGLQPSRDVSVVGLRAEEGCWFPETWLGSRMALGLLSPDKLDELRHVDSDKSLAAQMRDGGFDPDAVRAGKRHLEPAKVACFLEPHIEQGPVLATEGFPIGIVEAIMGGPRFRDARVLGRYAHAGGAPRAYRHDAVAALGDFIARVNAHWRELEADGHDTVFTFGIVETDAELHSFSRVPGEVRFCLDARGCRDAVMQGVRETLAAYAEALEQAHGVRFDFGPDSGPAILPMDTDIRADFARLAQARGIAAKSMPSGAGHDAGAFIEAGIPTAMLFIRNDHGSHNPDEAMDLGDFEKACQVLSDFIVAYPEAS